MKKSIIYSSMVSIFAVMSASPAFAQMIIEFQNPLKATSVSEVLLSFFRILVELGAVAVVLAIVYAGFLFVAARGNPEELNKAKKTLYYTIIGALILLGAEVIASVIQNTIKQL